MLSWRFDNIMSFVVEHGNNNYGYGWLKLFRSYKDWITKTELQSLYIYNIIV